MNPAVFLVILCLAVASATESPDVTLEVKEQEATITNEKPKEEEYRRKIWDQFMKKIEVYNKKKGLENEDISLEMNAFDDLTDSEFTKLMDEVLLPIFDGEEKTQTQPVGDVVKFDYSPASGDVQDQPE
ncbi:trophoblast-specific protein alpha-like [Microtus oregoni]|uniref:trophoblast-specific protein alpha-like n=1 Tax=Microtus oregoni TaxID=111838 RepID=UPI001BB0ECDD|nr:trophoblast-specific protein alpha-like [Microtus oregoni]